MRIAVASKDGQQVDEHFGKASRFLLYETSEAGSRFVEERRCVPLSSGDPDHAFDLARFQAVLKALAGCRRVYVSRIGQRPAEELALLGIEPVVCTGAIAAILPPVMGGMISTFL